MQTFRHFNLIVAVCLFASALSSSSTVVAGVAPNESCGGATTVAVPSTTAGSTVGATSDSAPSCGTGDGSGGALWYKVLGTGMALTASLCSDATDFDTKMRVYDGGCDALSCVAGNDDDGACASSTLQSTVDWTSTAGTEYLILVHGYGGSEGSFELSVSGPSAGPENDECGDAIPVAPGDSVDGDTTSASPASVEPCGEEESVIPGVWYSIEGHGGDITVSTCGDASYDTKIAVFEGACGDLTCVGVNDDGAGCAGFTSSLTFSSSGCTSYLVYVYGYDEDSYGTFTLSVIGDAPVVTNDTCSTAAAIAPGDAVGGDTSTATPDNDGACGSTNAPDVWFVVPGNGNDFTASLCGSCYDSKIAIFSGACGGLVCVGNNDDSCGLQSEISFPTAAGTDYYIRVYGYGSSSGWYELALTEEAPVVVENDACSGAIAVDLGTSVDGSTADAAAEASDPCGEGAIDSPAVWYSFPGTGGDVTVSTCDDAAFDTKLSVYAESCDALDCVGSNDDGAGCGGFTSLVTIETRPCTTYYVAVFGYDSEEYGTFTLTVTGDAPAVTNDACADAIDIAPGETEFGNTTNATFEENDCADDGAPSVWYRAVGDGMIYTASLCGSCYDTRVSVFSGGCESLSCVVSNDDFCGLQSEASWLTQSGAEYHIRVSGYGVDSFGGYSLALTATEPLANDVCAGATLVEINSTISDSSLGGTDAFKPVLDCAGGAEISSPGVWFEVQGTGGPMTASTCGTATFDSRIAVFSGACDDLTCIAENDDGPGCPDFTSEVTFDTNGCERYKILVFGYDSGEQGAFDLTVSATPPENDECAGAIDVAVASGATALVSGSTLGATPEALDPCGEGFTAAGVWYSFTATGHQTVVATCSKTTNFDTKLTLFTGSCDDLICSGVNDDYCGLQSAALIDTDEGATYFAVVHGFGSEAGCFELSIVDVEPCPNDDCADAASIDLEAGGSVTVSGDTFGSNPDPENDTCGNSDAPGCWFVVEGTGSDMTASTCDMAAYDSQISVFSGACGELTCVTSNDDGAGCAGFTSLAEWCGVLGERYFVLVHGFGSNFGQFDLSVSAAEVVVPSAPTGLTTTAGDGVVQLDWDDGGTPGTSLFKVYRSETSGGDYSLIATLSSVGFGASSYTDEDVVNGVTYYYVVTVCDVKGNESAFSEEASADPQAPGGLQLPGNCNQDSEIDMADALCLLDFLITGRRAALPCGDGSEMDPANVALMDLSGDEGLDLTDVILLLNYLFVDGQAHPLGTSCVRILGCPESCP